MANQKIIFVEGLWKSGKSTFIQKLKCKYQLKNINEPSHLDDPTLTTPKEISAWYLKEHYKNIDKAIDILKTDDAVIIERSPLASLVFINTYQTEFFENKKLLEEFKERLRFLKEKNIELVFIFLKQNNFSQIIERMGSDFNTKQYVLDLDLD